MGGWSICLTGSAGPYLYRYGSDMTEQNCWRDLLNVCD